MIAFLLLLLLLMHDFLSCINILLSLAGQNIVMQVTILYHVTIKIGQIDGDVEHIMKDKYMYFGQTVNVATVYTAQTDNQKLALL